MKTIYVYFQSKTNVYEYPEPLLYGWTTHKKIANKFESDRDMNLFCKKVKDVNEADLTKFQAAHSKQKITNIGFETIDKNPITGAIHSKYVYVVGTFYEEEYVFINTDKLSEKITNATNKFGKCVTKEYMEVLHFFLYYEFSKFKITEMSDPFYSGLFPGEDIPHNINFITNSPDVKYDQLSVFLYFFGYTFKIKDVKS